MALWDAIRAPAAHGIVIEGVDMTRLVRSGASPRGMSYLLRAARVRAWLEGRDMVVPEDLREVFPEVMAHRIFIDPVYELRRERIVGELIAAMFQRVPAP
jgi:MoxR-like ATPase